MRGWRDEDCDRAPDVDSVCGDLESARQDHLRAAREDRAEWLADARADLRGEMRAELDPADWG